MVRSHVWVVLATLFLVSSVIAETSVKGPEAFEEAWKAYTTGKSCREQFAAIAVDESANKKDRFNSEYVLGVLALSKTQHETALKHLERAQDLIADRPQVQLRMAQAWLQAKQPKKARPLLKKIRKSIKRKKSLRVPCQLAMAELEKQMGATDKALARLEALAKKHRKDWRVQLKLAAAYESVDDFVKALAMYERVIAADSKKDPFAGIYAYQRWAALAVSSDQGSYGKKELMKIAIRRYRIFLDRAEVNEIPADLRKTTEQAVWVLEKYGAK